MIVFVCGLLLLASASANFLRIPDNVCLPNPPAEFKMSPPFSTCESLVKEGLAKRHPDQNKNTEQILATYGYPFEIHTVITNDSYILTVYRITGSPNLPQSSQKVSKPAVYLQHGMTLASDCWNFQQGSRNLPFKLADAGFEVWLGSARGTTYSSGHLKYNSNLDLKYWDFSWHEMGMYDVPAVTERILSVSGQSKIFFVGHSMGTTQYLVSLSELPEMNDKFHAGFMMAPIAYMGHMNNLAVRMAVPTANTDGKYQIMNKAMGGRLWTFQTMRTQFGVTPGDFCAISAAKCGLCDNILFAVMGYNAPQMNNTELPNFLAKIPNVISMKSSAHYAQSISSCQFRQYDYGILENRKRYGQMSPPDYQLENIRAPLYFFYGKGDNLGPPNDVQITASKLAPGVLKGDFLVDQEYFNHMDFLLAKDADILVYNQILEEMQSILEKSNNVLK